MSESILDTEVATFPCVKGFGRARNRRLSAILHDIKSGAWASEVFGMRHALEIGHRDIYDADKAKLPSFFISGAAADRKRMINHSGFVQVDLDKCGDRFRELRENIIYDPHAAAVFTSPSGQGIKVVFHIEPVEFTEEAHKQAFAAVSDYIEGRYEIKPDPACKNWNRHCLVSHDPDLYTNSGAIPYQWKASKDLKGGGEEEYKTESSESSTSFCITINPLHHSTSHTPVDGYEKELRALEAESEFRQKQPNLATLYDRYVVRMKAEKGRRYEALTKTAPFLFYAVSIDVARILLTQFYDCNPVFATGRDEHIREVESMLSDLDESYIDMLSETERAFFSLLQERERTVFRICRDLAIRNDPEPAPLFPLSDNELALRLNEHPMIGYRILKRFETLKIISVERKHRKGSKGVQALATVWRWRLPLPQAQAAA